MRKFIISNREAGQRFDKFLVKYFSKAPKSFIYKMLRKKNITLNGKKAAGSESLTEGDEIKMFLSEETIDGFHEVSFTRSRTDLDIVYEDEKLLIVSKPAGMLSQKAKRDDVSLVEYIITYCLNTGSVSEEELNYFRPGICNRLDRNTSGLVVAGKTLSALQVFSRLLLERSLEKYYLAVVVGKVKENQKIEAYLSKDEKTNKVTVSSHETEGSDYIETAYAPICEGEAFSLIRIKLITGKSHQIRAHLSSIGHPIAGDAKYGNAKINQMLRSKYQLQHQLLHAYELKVPEMDAEYEYLSGRTFTAGLPEYYKRIIEDIFMTSELKY